jgi:glutaredoxin
MKLKAIQLLAAVALVAAAGVQAQQVYRIVGPDGRVTFSDKPPPAGATPNARPTGGNVAGASGSGILPFELRQVVSRYPVTLYTGQGCGPCGSGRAFLMSRGVPFTERTITTQEDQQALQRISGEASIPLLTIGGQQIRGFSDAEWSQFLDAANYPKTSMLPASYTNPPAAPLVAVQRPAAPDAAPTQNAGRAPEPAAPAPAPAPPNPAGIVF